jgi:hypothetical protein
MLSHCGATLAMFSDPVGALTLPCRDQYECFVLPGVGWGSHAAGSIARVSWRYELDDQLSAVSKMGDTATA